MRFPLVHMPRITAEADTATIVINMNARTVKGAKIVSTAMIEMAATVTAVRRD